MVRDDVHLEATHARRGWHSLMLISSSLCDEACSQQRPSLGSHVACSSQNVGMGATSSERGGTVAEASPEAVGGRGSVRGPHLADRVHKQAADGLKRPLALLKWVGSTSQVLAVESACTTQKHHHHMMALDYSSALHHLCTMALELHCYKLSAKHLTTLRHKASHRTGCSTCRMMP